MSTWKGYRKRLELRFPAELVDQIRAPGASLNGHRET